MICVYFGVVTPHRERALLERWTGYVYILTQVVRRGLMRDKCRVLLTSSIINQCPLDEGRRRAAAAVRRASLLYFQHTNSDDTRTHMMALT